MHNSRPMFSVVMPFFNAELTLNEAIESVVDQTDKDWELLLIDDNSSDDSLKIAEKWCEEDPRVQVYFNPERGIVGALNVGVDRASGKWIARMDSDDLCHADRLMLSRIWIEKQPTIDVFSCLVTTFPETTDGMNHYITWLNSVQTSDELHRDIYIESPIAHPTAIIRASTLKRVDGYRSGSFPEDYDLWLRLHHQNSKFLKIPETLFYWRESPNRLSRVDSRYSLDSFRDLKAYHLAHNRLHNTSLEVQIWGAGVDGKKWRKSLLKQGIEVRRFFDIDPKKIGGAIGGTVPVLHWKELTNFTTNTLTLGAVGSKGSRKLMRKGVAEIGLTEPEQFLFVQ